MSRALQGKNDIPYDGGVGGPCVYLRHTRVGYDVLHVVAAYSTAGQNHQAVASQCTE